MKHTKHRKAKSSPPKSVQHKNVARKFAAGKIKPQAAATRPAIESGFVMGIAKRQGKTFLIESVSKRDHNSYQLADGKKHGINDGDLVKVKLDPRSKEHKLKRVEFVENFGDINNAGTFSLIAIHSLSIPHEFPEEALAQAAQGAVPSLGAREDLRNISLVTIDGADARDFDDAVFAEPDGNGWHLIVAIADVSYYVRSGNALDQEAFNRGNSVYFPDRVVPMLPEALSNDLCSLRPNEPRAAMAVHLWINANGNLQKHKFTRALIRSHARLTYEQVQEARDSNADKTTTALMDKVINPLYSAYQALLKARLKRGTLDLDVPERKVQLGDDGKVIAIVPRTRLDSHRLIEEFMVLANVAAAMELIKHKSPCIFRIHDHPDVTKLDIARQVLSSMGLELAKGNKLAPKDFTKLLDETRGREDAHVVHQLILRSQSQAIYSPNNIGHFGLALERYAHFTSPIRRYADLIVHRSLIRALDLGDGGLTDYEAKQVDKIAEHISVTERRAVEAERQTMDRYTASFLENEVGAVFNARISSVTRFGLFVTLDDTGADGIIPMRNLGGDYFTHDEPRQQLVGQRTKYVYKLGQRLTVRLLEANVLTGGLAFEPVQQVLEQPAPKTAAKSSAAKPTATSRSFKQRPGSAAPQKPRQRRR